MVQMLQPLLKTKHYANIFWVDLKKKIYIVSLKDFENFS